ncbi:Protein LAS1 like protein [Cyphomyrmex costatus]|uniref:Protein LAS1 like protein n=1 Tax=Cyphomyrmex costatus TaxID=456900 RepID=A0A195CIC6_9HYME|nr:Protein LAS1 like protein [Cyphomyrmex costatus]
MAVSGKHDGIKQVPWLSPAEWHDVYRQIYSNDAVEQTKAYETLLTWKARRMPKLPAGVDCTLSILQVCLRDREWTSKIDNGELPMYCENDLSLMYSTTIMRFLNYFSNIGQTKQTSMFKIANQLKIPEWIVELRHETAHGHELPSIGVLRVAINILLLWLHDEYWAPEAHAMEKCYLKKGEEVLEEEGESEVEDFTYMIEIWTTVSLYVTADYKLVSDLPDTQLREMLQDLRTYMLSEYRSKTSDNAENEYVSVYKRTIKMDKEYNLQAAKTLLLAKISIDLNKSSNNYQWIGCPIGLLPWQVDSLKSLEPLQLNPSKHPVSVLDSQIVAGIINRKNLKMQSCIKWDDVLRKKRRIERKCNKGVVDVMNRALEIVKNQK